MTWLTISLRKLSCHKLPPVYLPVCSHLWIPFLVHHEFTAFASREGQLSSCTVYLILWTPLFKAMLLSFSSLLNLQCPPARSSPSVWRHFISSNHKTPSLDLSSHPAFTLFLSSHRRKTPWKLSNHSTYPFSPDHTTISTHPLHSCESPQFSVFVLLHLGEFATIHYSHFLKYFFHLASRTCYPTYLGAFPCFPLLFP